ncbi:MAG: 23S rRNA (guanosine(2251)-2'-O)-methyltransferase RlmB [Campylobacterales bacterium]|nr:23S rRNA (guanosine(2251)-2'-O)-methyltransferase RlmB [Campylobacterales bacterium]NQY52716.1 23S rRNA (guanosine(2251)-2'-O)-methyltransferase RlmB [Campylobacteraceae bacterium]
MIIYGKQIVLYVLEKHAEQVEEVYFAKDIDQKLFSKFLKLGKKIHKVDNMKAQGMAKGGNHQGFLVKLKEFKFAPIKEVKDFNFVLVLDGLTDVGNIGAITRSAYSLGVDAIILTGLKNVKMSGVIRTSSGAALDMPIALYKSSQDLANELSQTGFTLIGATTDGVDLKKYGKIEKTDKVAVYLGSEGEGLSGKIRKKMDLKVSIGMEHEFDSLNVSVAAGILIYNLKR